MSHRQRSWFCLLLGLSLLWLAGRQHSGLSTVRAEHELQHAPPEDTTPLVAVTTVAFGGFRGLVADALWIRANKLQEEGEFFELVQLATWITQLEPRIPEVWSFQSWNLAYNVSVLFPDSENRWRWVLHGIHLLRDEGLKHNPNSASLHWDLGWLFQHKIGFSSDTAHLHYKRRWAEMMTDLLGGPSTDLAALPEGVTQRLRGEFGMDPDAMRSLEQAVGRLDWRMPQTHSLYWAWTGRGHARKPFDRLRLQRMVYQNLANLTRQGELVLHAESNAYVAKPRPDLIPAARAAFAEAFDLQLATHSIRDAYRSFLIDSSILYFELNQEAQSKALFEELTAYLDGDEQPGSYEDFLQRFYVQVDPRTLPPEAMAQRILNMLTRAQAWRLQGGDSDAQQLETRARALYRLFEERIETEGTRERLGLPPFAAFQHAAHTPSRHQ